jgi:uroporphyrinogen III methyltransferase / synthase
VSLAGATVLVTRSPEQALSMARMIEERDGVPLLFPALEIGPPPSWEPCDKALTRLDSFDAIVFPGVNAVNGFFARCAERGIGHHLIARLSLYAVGPATQQAIEGFGFDVQATPGVFSAAGLLGLLRERPPGRVLIPRGNRGRVDLVDGLRGLGTKVEAIPVYDSAPTTGDPAVRERLVSGGVDIVTFASPSAVDGTVAALEPGTLAGLRATTAIAVIGPTTLEAVRAAGADADIIPEEATISAMLDAIEHYLGRHIHE